MKIQQLLLLFILLAYLNIAFGVQPVSAKNGMVVTSQAAASQAGVDILRAGGNAIDAAVAVGYALAVVEPCCGNIGGGGFMTLHLANGKNIFINFREKAPLRANKDMYLDKQGGVNFTGSSQGYLSVGVPGSVLGLETALQKYGTMTRRQVMAPAIRLAQEGYRVTPTDAKFFKKFAGDFRQQPNIAAIFLKQGHVYKTGDVLVQKNLAKTLQQIQNKGPDVFYHGPIAEKIVQASRANHGILTLKDFKEYNIEILHPVYCQYRNYTIISAPPPSSGGVTLCEMLNILENFPPRSDIRKIIEAMGDGFADRNAKLGDPDFINNPVEQFLSKNYSKKLAAKIQHSYFAPVNNLFIKQHELTDTTHYSVIDKKGNAAAVTYTINGFFGAKIMAGDTGFFLNNEMNDFSIKSNTPNKFGLVESSNNNIQPGKRPLSSMTPTIILKNNKLYMVLGSPGGSRIITAVLLTLLHVIDDGMNIQQAVNAPRFHYQVEPNVVNTEPFAFSWLTTLLLEYKGYHIASQGMWGAVAAIVKDPVNGTLYGANDKRRPAGKAMGY